MLLLWLLRFTQVRWLWFPTRDHEVLKNKTNENENVMMVTLLQEFQPLDSNLDLKSTVSISQWYLILGSCMLILHNSSTHMMMFSSNINKMLHVWMKECLWFLENTHDSLGTVNNWRFSGSLKVHSPSRWWHNSSIHISARHGDHQPLLGLWLSWKQITAYMTWSSSLIFYLFVHNTVEC